jgi:hypothetical protein
MRNFKAALAAVLLIAQSNSCSAFTLNNSRHASSSSFAASVPPLFSVQQREKNTAETKTGAPCDIPQDVESTSLMNQPNAGRILRSSVVTDINGDFIPLDRPMGKGTSVVVFLRHLG